MRAFLFSLVLLGTVAASASPGFSRPNRDRHGDVQLQRLRVGDEVVTAGGSIGTVAGIFGDRDVSVKIGYTLHTVSRANVAGKGCSARACDGTQATTRGGSSGEIIGIFPSGDVGIKIGYTAHKVSRANIAIEGCMGSICAGDQVTTRGGSQGTVNGVFQNGDISVKIGYTNHTVSYQNVSSNQSSSTGDNSVQRVPQVGETAYTAGGSEGKVMGVFANGDVSIQIGYTVHTVSRSNIAVTGCYRRLCSNDAVVTRGGSQGTLNGIFPSGDVSVKIGYTNHKLAYDSVARSN